jgi:hypothetical protein
MNVVTYEQRVSQIKTVEDVGVQLVRAKQYVMRLRVSMKKAEMLAEKIEYSAAIKEAEAVLRKLRINVFALEDAVSEQSAA